VIGLAALRYAMRDASTLARRRARDIGAYWLLMFCMATGRLCLCGGVQHIGFVDAALAHGDRLHFDWVACYEFVARRPRCNSLARGSMVRCSSRRWRCWG
jgi:hypothetical protein